MNSPIRSARPRVARLPLSDLFRFFAVVLAFCCADARGFAVTATTTTLAISSTNVPYKTPITLTATASSGTVGNYTLVSTVGGVGAFTSPGPSGTVTYIDTSAGNNPLGTAALGPPVLTNNFSQAPNSPFAIADGSNNSQIRSLVVASSYLDGDNNIDVV